MVHSQYLREEELNRIRTADEENDKKNREKNIIVFGVLNFKFIRTPIILLNPSRKYIGIPELQTLIRGRAII